VLRRAWVWNEHSKPVFHASDLVIDFARNRVFLGSKEMNLTSTEYRLLSYIAGNADRVVTPDQILEKVWDKEHIGGSHLIQVNISRLRWKLVV
jgi:two-component system KDP operon response regulator KdpE